MRGSEIILAAGGTGGGMTLRGLAVLVLILGSLPIALVHPFVGVLTWNWLAYMNPHQQTWGALDQYRLAYAVAIATILGLLVSGRDGFRFIRSRNASLVGAFFITLIISTVAAGNKQEAFQKLTQYAKIFLMCYVMICLVRTERRFRVLTWTTALFICLIGMKGALVGSARGFPRIYGPARSFITDNNDYALAMNMMLPFFWVIAATEKDKRLKALWYACLGLTVVAVLFTYSRGGFIGLGITVAFMAFKSKRKIVGVLVLAAGIVVGSLYAPERLEERFGSLRQIGDIQTEETAAEHAGQFSAQDRVRAWRVGWAMGKDRPLTGVGLRNFRAHYTDYAPEDVPDYAKVAHSAYFHILGEAGFVALILFVTIILSCLLTLYGLRRRLNRVSPEEAAALQAELVGESDRPHALAPPDLLDRMKRYVAMCEVSIVSYAVTASFLSRADFDLYFQVVAMVVALQVMVRRGLAGASEAAAERGARAGAEPLEVAPALHAGRR